MSLSLARLETRDFLEAVVDRTRVLVVAWLEQLGWGVVWCGLRLYPWAVDEDSWDVLFNCDDVGRLQVSGRFGGTDDPKASRFCLLSFASQGVLFPLQYVSCFGFCY